MDIIVITWDDPMPPGDKIAEIFREKGCYVKEIKYRPSIKEFRKIKDSISNEISQMNPDMVFIMKGAGISPEHLYEFKALGHARYFLWVVDDPILRWKKEWPPVFKEPTVSSYPLYDHIFVYDSFYANQLKMMGLDNVSYLPCCYDNRYFPMNTDLKYEIVFYGTHFPKREKILLELDDHNLTIAGIGWQDSPLAEKCISVDAWYDANRIYNQSKILLNIHHPQSVNGANLRCFEAMASGRMLITESLKDLRDMFIEDEGIVFYYDVEDLRKKIAYYLKHDEERERIALNGYKAVKKAHSLSHRVDSILERFHSIEP